MKKLSLIIIISILIPAAYIFYPRTFLPSPLNQALLTFRFDDGFKSQKRALTILSRKSIPATLFVIGTLSDTPGYLTRKSLKNLVSHGHEIGFHSNSHKNLLLLGPEKHRQEISSADFTAKTGLNAPASFAYPYGFYNPLFISRIKKEYRGACAYPVLRNGGFNGGSSNPWLLDCIEITSHVQFAKLLEEAIAEKLWLVACFHRVSDKKGPWSITLDEFKKIAGEASEKRNTGAVKIVTIKEGVKIIPFHISPEIDAGSPEKNITP